MKLEIRKNIPQNPNDFPPLLFVHGMCHAAWYWQENFMPWFAERGFTSYALSLRNHGKSDSEKPLNQVHLSEYVEDVQKAIDEIGTLPILVGHSMGGLITQLYLSEKPAKGAILLTPVPHTGTVSASRNSKLKNKITRWVLLWKKSFLFTLNTPEKAQKSLYSRDLSMDLVKKYQQLVEDESLQAYWDMRYPDVPTKYHTQIPMLVVAAEKDNLLTASSIQNTAKHFGATFILVKNTAHNLMLDTRWEWVAQQMLDWLETNESMILSNEKLDSLIQ